MCFEINRCSDDFSVPRQIRDSYHQGLGEPKITGAGWEYGNDDAWNQQDEAIRTGARRSASAGQGATGEATMCPEINRYGKLPSRPQGRAGAGCRWPARAIEVRRDGRQVMRARHLSLATRHWFFDFDLIVSKANGAVYTHDYLRFQSGSRFIPNLTKRSTHGCKACRHTDRRG
jgi:hypothetical protein